MNKYFWISSLVIVCYGIGTMIIAFINDGNDVFSIYYVAGEFLQLAAIALCLKACNILDNISDTAFIIRYSMAIIIFFGLYIYVNGVSSRLYILMFIYKIIITTVIGYTILIKWNLDRRYKISALIIYTLSYAYLSIYDFLLYGEDYQTKSIYVSAAVVFALLQAVECAVLYKAQSDHNSSIRSEYLNIFAENSSDIIFYYTFKPYPRFSFVSVACERILGYKQKDFYNNNGLMIEMAKEEYRNTVKDIFTENDIEYEDVTIEVESKNMEKIFLQCIANKVKDGGKVVACEGVFRDVTYRIENDRKMEENNTNRNLMLSYISHDLRTPITYIIGYIEAMQKNILASEEEKKLAMDSIHRNGKTLLGLVDDISLLSKLESGRFNYNYEKFTCMELFEHLEETCNIKAADNLKGINGIGERKFSTEIDFRNAENSSLLVDIDRIDQLFDNIMSNAVKATDESGIIKLKMKVEDGRAVMAVSDNGIGISEEDLPFIFDNFYRSPQMKNRRNGSGLGLSISKQIVNGHNGTICVESKQGEGSTFKVTLPLYEPSA